MLMSASYGLCYLKRFVVVVSCGSIISGMWEIGKISTSIELRSLF